MSIGYEDVVAAEVDPDGMLRYTGLIAASGHSVIRVLMRDRAGLQGGERDGAFEYEEGCLADEHR